MVKASTHKEVMLEFLRNFVLSTKSDNLQHTTYNRKLTTDNRKLTSTMNNVNFDDHLFIITAGFGIISLIAGYIMYRFPPKEINHLYGYRTSSSMKNQQQWEFAQRYSSKEMMKVGVINMLFSVIGLGIHIPDTFSMILGLGIMILSVVILFIRTERAIKN